VAVHGDTDSVTVQAVSRLNGLWQVMVELGKRAVKLPPVGGKPAGLVIWRAATKIIPTGRGDEGPCPGRWANRIKWPHPDAVARLHALEKTEPEPAHFIKQIVRIPEYYFLTYESCAQLAYNVGQLLGWRVPRDGPPEGVAKYYRMVMPYVRLADFVECAPEKDVPGAQWAHMLSGLQALAR
jgi:hypothetical protein